MQKYLTLFAIFFASVLQLTEAQKQASPIKANNPSQGFNLNKRTRKTRKLSEITQEHGSIIEGSLSDLRQWKEEDYEAIMNTMSGGLRHRQLQRGSDNGGYQNQKKPYYTMQQTTVRKWQKILLASFATLTLFLALYVCALKRELSSLNQYLPLGYKLFPDEEVTFEEQRAVDGVELR